MISFMNYKAKVLANTEPEDVEDVKRILFQIWLRLGDEQQINEVAEKVTTLYKLTGVNVYPRDLRFVPSHVWDAQTPPNVVSLYDKVLRGTASPAEKQELDEAIGETWLDICANMV